MGRKERYIPKHVKHAEVTSPKVSEIVEGAIILSLPVFGGVTGAWVAQGRYGLAAVMAGVTAAEAGVNISLVRSDRRSFEAKNRFLQEQANERKKS